MTELPTQTTYDEVPYPHYPHRHAHPRHLETMAALFGLQPPEITSARVLELGCAAGSNLIPQAVDLPGSSFLGVDLSARQVADGRAVISALGLGNVELRQADILDIDERWGKFDYILCHGVYSWVPPTVQEKILDICKRNLSDNGVAIVSYNTYPGWHMKSIVRDLMCYHASQFSKAEDRIVQAVAVLRFLAESGHSDKALELLLKEEMELVEKSNDGAYLFHEYLETHNRPVYFHEFIGQASARGLQYLSEAEFHKVLLRNFPEKVQSQLGKLGLVQQEQYMDFLRCNKFRSTLLCHSDVVPDRQVTPERMRQFHVRFATFPQMSDVDIRTGKLARFEVLRGRLDVDMPIVKAALVYLRERFPLYVSFDELCAVAIERVQQAAGPAQLPVGAIPAALLMGYAAAIFEICVHPPQCVTRIAPKPHANPLARLQAAGADRVTNQLHQMISLNGLQRHIVRRLDGAHDRSALVGSVAEAIQSGELVVKKDNRPVKSLDPQTVSGLVDSALSQLSQSALLID